MAIEGSMGKRHGADLSGPISRLRGGDGGILLVEGEPGAGKSRLADEARAIAGELPVRVLSGAGRYDRRHLPFGAFLRALDDSGPPIIDAGLLATLSECTEQWFWLLRAVRDQLARAAQDGPLLVVIDDLQWCDAGTLAALRTLPGRLSAHPILWLVTVRPGSPDADVRATAATLADNGARTVRLARPREDPPEEGDAHAPVHSPGSVRHAMAGLSPVTRDVLRLAAVLGRDLEVRRLADLGGHPIIEVVAALQEAVGAGLVRPTDPLTFRDDVRAAVRGTVPASLRRSLRGRAAERSLAQGAPVGQVALAMAGTAGPGDGEAAAGLLRGGLAELVRVSPDAAVPIARRLVALAPAGSAERAEAVADALPLLARTGRGGEARTLAGTVLDRRGPDGALPPAVEARVRLAAAMAAMAGSFAEVLRHSRAGARLDGVPDDLRAPLRALRCLATLLTGDVQAAERMLERSAGDPPPADDGTAAALLRTAGSLARAVRLDFTGAERLAAEAVAAVPDPSALFFPAVWRASLHGLTGRVEEGLRETADGVAAARRPGHAQGLSLWLAARARLLLAAGRPAEARAEAEAALAAAEESGAGEDVSRVAFSVIERAARVRRAAGGTGQRRRAVPRRAARGWDALTPAEWRVAALVAEGATNRRAAERLFLSPATVGTHVMHIFQKLGINSRVELAHAYLKRGDSAA